MKFYSFWYLSLINLLEKWLLVVLARSFSLRLRLFYHYFYRDVKLLYTDKWAPIYYVCPKIGTNSIACKELVNFHKMYISKQDQLKKLYQKFFLSLWKNNVRAMHCFMSFQYRSNSPLRHFSRQKFSSVNVISSDVTSLSNVTYFMIKRREVN